MIALLMVLMGFMIVTPPVAAHTADDPFEVILYADGGGGSIDTPVGKVQVWNDVNNLYVKYKITEDYWVITETHLSIGITISDIPQTKGKHKNPIPGQFEYSSSHDITDEVKEYLYTIPLSEIGEEGVAYGDPLNIAAHAVVKDISCYKTAFLYGLERYHGNVYSIDVLSGASTLEFTTIAPPKGSAKPNGLAYDAVNDRVYYCDYQYTTTLYFWDTTEHNAGSLTGEIACADFYNGKYYYITGPPSSDDLYEVAFNADGTIATGYPLKIADIANNEHGWTFNGDIAVKNGVVYGWGLCNVHGYEFFTYDLTTNAFNVNTVSYKSSLQLAFGSDGTLYGHRSGGDGEFYKVDTTNGAVTKITPLPDPIVLYTDCASGEIGECEPVTETAWGNGATFPGAKNWGMYFEYITQTPPDEIVTYPETGNNVYIGYEDWPNGDFDYNDFGMTFSVVETYSFDGYLKEVLMTFTMVIYDSGADHNIHIKRPIIGSSTVEVTRSNVADGAETATGTYSKTGDVDITLFDTAKYPWPSKQTWIEEGRNEIDWVEVIITVGDPSSNPKTTSAAPRWDLDAFMANYDPWEIGTSGIINGADFYINDMQTVTATGGGGSHGGDSRLVGETVPHILVVPSTDWIPPYEDTCICGPGDWGPYQYFYDYYHTSGTSHPNWHSEVTNNWVGYGGLSWGPYP